ncbi:alpha/beta-Hydrolases superfamily protein [Artemisia annua]|uniref:Alpha/beta-Hydrolases superfamily protein n=1 Tax=Artemisia annua TaxID=35608 RepID=A0A2U1M6P9_ARTAN|nr:alpha/beta-Hydrolases superfamily protein [Artemisia annua]
MEASSEEAEASTAHPDKEVVHPSSYVVAMGNTESPFVGVSPHKDGGEGTSRTRGPVRQLIGELVNRKLGVAAELVNRKLGFAVELVNRKLGVAAELVNRKLGFELLQQKLGFELVNQLQQLRLVPENKYPAAFEDGMTVLYWLGKQANLAECGKSLGGKKMDSRKSDVQGHVKDASR